MADGSVRPVTSAGLHFLYTPRAFCWRRYERQFPGSSRVATVDGIGRTDLRLYETLSERRAVRNGFANAPSGGLDREQHRRRQRTSLGQRILAFSVSCPRFVVRAANTGAAGEAATISK